MVDDLVHDLLESASSPHATAAEAPGRCRHFLAASCGRWALLLRLLSTDRRDDLVALVAWFSAVRELAHQPHGAERLARTLEAALEHDATAALGVALGAAVQRQRLPAMLLRGPLLASERASVAGSFETWSELDAAVHRLAVPEARAYLHVLGLRGEREELLAENLATGLQLTHWIVHLRTFLARGALVLPMEELRACGVELTELERGRESHGTKRLAARAIARAREHLARGWELCGGLGPVQARQLAFLLRWHAASLSGLEARDHRLAPGAPPAGWLRLTACGLAAAVSARCPL